MKTEFVQELGSPGFTVETESYHTQAPADTTSYLVQEFELWRNLFHAQPRLYKNFLETQGSTLAEAIIQNASWVRFALPDELTLPARDAYEGVKLTFPVPIALREQKVGGLIGRLKGTDLAIELRKKLDELETNIDSSIAASAGLIRYATATHIVYCMLPAGHRINYSAAPGEDIPNIPPAGDFYLPQWVSFDNQDNLLVNSIQEAEAHLASMQQFLEVLRTAVTLAPYFVVDPEYQQKRYGMLGQLVNQGRAMARYEMKEIIQIIQQRIETKNLNRGLSLDLTYFDDRCLEKKSRRIVVIPSGKIMFHSAFMILAARSERKKVAQDTSLSPSTRKHLQAELMSLERAFGTSKIQNDK